MTAPKVTKHGNRYRVAYREKGVLKRESFPTEEEAQAFLDKRAGFTLFGTKGAYGMAEALGRKKSTPTVADYAETLVPSAPKQATRDRYAKCLRLKLRPSALGEMQLGAVESADLRAFFDSITTDKPFTNSFVRKVFNRAVLDGIIKSNPFDRVEKLKGTQTKDKKIIPLTVGEVEMLADAVSKGRYGARNVVAIHVAAYAGLRGGELGGLRPRDVVRYGEGFCELHVSQNVTDTSLGRGVGTTKSDRERAVPIDCDLADELEAYIEAQGTDRDGFIFMSEQGNPFDHTNLTRITHKAARLAGRPDLSGHELRHTYASLLNEANVPITDIRDALGHSSIVVTSRYLQRFPSANRRVAEKMAAIRSAARLPSPRAEGSTVR